MVNTAQHQRVERVEVAVPLPMLQTFDFAVPPELSQQIQVGKRIVVPFQGRLLIAYVVGLNPPQKEGLKLKAISLIVDEESPIFNPKMVEFLMWVSSYYQAPLGEVFKGAHPSGMNAKSEPCLRLTETSVTVLPGMYPEDLEACINQLKTVGGMMPISELNVQPSASQLKKWIKFGVIEKGLVLKKPRVDKRTEQLWSVQHPPPSLPRGRGGRHLKIDLLHADIARLGPIRSSALRQLSNYSSSALKQLNEQGAISSTTVAKAQTLFDEAITVRDVAPELNTQQAAAVQSIQSTQGFQGFLLRGVTGSGKTEVYLRLIEHVLREGRGALVLVPEIALTPQLVSRFRARLGDDISVLHSGMTDQRRLTHWTRLQRGEIKLAIGARSAVFAPVENLGIIVVDEEHDPSFKQGEGVRYHGRDVAIMRAFRAKCPIVLGSATPSLETLYNVKVGKLRRLDLTIRAAGGMLPPVKLIDLRTEPRVKNSILTRAIVEAIEKRIREKEQTIVFLNRRGFSTFALCEACGEVIECDQCSISMTWHRQKKRLACHYCDAARPLPKACPKCHKECLVTLGAGTEKVEDTLKTLFPSANIARLDRDTAQGRGLETVLSDMKSRSIDILVGTQMVTKGHDFPYVTLVCVMDADAGLKLPDFRAGERTVQLLTQVAGRAGRASRPGEVLIQTYDPNHFVLRAIQSHDHERFVERETETRALFGYPPYHAAVILRTEGHSPNLVASVLNQFAQFIQSQGRDGQFMVRGPTPAIVERIRGKSRFALLITHPNRKQLHQLIKLARNNIEIPSSVRLIVDIDPLDLM